MADSDIERDVSIRSNHRNGLQISQRGICKPYFHQGLRREARRSVDWGAQHKLQDYRIVDYIERNARDPMRKLGPDDRLVGSARMVESYGVAPENLCTSIAAAIYYTSEGDPSAEELKRLREEKGVDYILENVCKLEPDGELAKLVKSKIALLKSEGWIRE